MSLTVSVEKIVEEALDPLLAIHPSWQRVPLDNVARILNGYAFESRYFNANKGVPLIRIRDVGKSTTECKYHSDYDETYLIKPGDFIVGMDGDFKCAQWQGPAALLNQRVCKIAISNNGYHSRFLEFALPGYLAAIGARTSSQTVKHLSSSSIAAIPLPLPPLEEQHRIAAKIESCVAHVNSARDRLSRVPAILKRFRQAVLAAACSGRLTDDLRTQNKSEVSDVVATTTCDADENAPELPEGWRWQKLGHTAKVQRGRFSVRPRNDPAYYNGRFPFVQIGDLPATGGEIHSYKQSLNERGLAVSKCFPKGTVLIAIVGATIGNTGVLTFESCCPDSLVAIQAKSVAMSRFIEYYLRWKKLQVRNESYASGGQPNINLQTLIPLPVPVPPVDEVEAIVCRVEGLFQLAKGVDRRVAFANRWCELLEQAVLARAFRGELVPTEAELARREGRKYEPASVLLERIKTGRVTQTSQKLERKRTTPKLKLARAKG